MSFCFDVAGRESGVWVDVNTNDGQRTPVHLFLLLVWYAKRTPQVEQAFLVFWEQATVGFVIFDIVCHIYAEGIIDVRPR